MIKGNVLFNSTTWVYDYYQAQMSALRGHKYHILPTSSSPLVISLALLSLLLVLVFNFHGAKTNLTFFDCLIESVLNFFNKEILHKKTINLFLAPNQIIIDSIVPLFSNYPTLHLFWLAPFFLTLGCFFMWSSNAIEEGVTIKINFFSFYKNSLILAAKPLVEPMFHSNLVRKGFKIGFILFIISEVMFFFGFFWAFFHSAISPSIQIGAVWPPLEVEFITVKGFAVANTVILLTSGATLTIAHYGFELIPQKWNKLYSNNVAFSESEKAFETRLNEDYSKLNKELFNSAKPEIYRIPFFKFLKNSDLDVNKTEITSVVIPFNILINPFSKYFQWNLGLKDTETLIRIYINLMLNATLLLALLFMAFQATEYFISPVSINTGVYGSTFYMITGLHGAHVFIGTCFLFYCWTAVSNWKNSKTLINLFSKIFNFITDAIPVPQFVWIVQASLMIEPTRYKILLDYLYEPFENPKKSKIEFHESTSPYLNYGKYGIESFESAAWYWHFVDVVWIFVFGFVYVWSHLTVLELQ